MSLSVPGAIAKFHTMYNVRRLQLVSLIVFPLKSVLIVVGDVKCIFLVLGL